MSRLIPYFCFFFLFLFSCSPSSDQNVAASLKDKKYSIDSLINKERKLIPMVKLKGQETVTTIPKDKSHEVETIYNVFKDKKGQIIYISEMPKSPDEEWFIAYKSYFDENGNLFAFQRQNNFFNSECTKGAALESLTKYYNDKLEVIDSAYTLTDSYKKDLDKSVCKFPYNFPYKIHKSVAAYRLHAKGL